MTEAHLDRAADIRFSTEVFERSCAPPLLALALPLFSAGRGRRPPAAIVDVGCGEATLLAALFRALRETPATSGAAADLVLVGIENNPVADAAARRTLAASGAHYAVIGGDVTHPDAIARDLADLGIDLADALHVNKSVIHDRELLVGETEAPPSLVTGISDLAEGVFARPDGTLVSAGLAQDDLWRFFERWRPYLRRHGMITLEPHSLTVEEAAPLSGCSLTVVMEALHGFSCQYLTTAGRFAEAAVRAELTILDRRMIGSALCRHDHMSCNHLIADPAL